MSDKKAHRCSGPCCDEWREVIAAKDRLIAEKDADCQKAIKRATASGERVKTLERVGKQKAGKESYPGGRKQAMKKIEELAQMRTSTLSKIKSFGKPGDHMPKDEPGPCPKRKIIDDEYAVQVFDDGSVNWDRFDQFLLSSAGSHALTLLNARKKKAERDNDGREGK